MKLATYRYYYHGLFIWLMLRFEPFLSFPFVTDKLNLESVIEPRIPLMISVGSVFRLADLSPFGQPFR